MSATLLWTSLHFPKICKPLVVYQFYCMALFHSQTRRHMIKANKMKDSIKVKKIINYFNSLYTSDFYRRRLANSEDPNEILHQGLLYLPRPKQYSEKEIQFLFGIYNL